MSHIIANSPHAPSPGINPFDENHFDAVELGAAFKAVHDCGCADVQRNIVNIVCLQHDAALPGLRLF